MAIKTNCPHCGNLTVVPEHDAGASGPCGVCGKSIAIEGDRPTTAAAGHDVPPQSSNKGLMTVLILVVVGAAAVPVIAIMAALLLPAIQAAREAANVSACRNNLQEIALAIRNHHEERGELPPAYLTDENGRPMHSWRVLILPYFHDPEAQALYDKYDFNEPWNGPNNRQLADQMPSFYRCPSDDKSSSITNYVTIVGPHTALRPAKIPADRPVDRYRSHTNLASIVDGQTKTLVVVEVTGALINWLEPTDLDIAALDQAVNSSRDGKCICSRHPNKVNVALVSGDLLSLKQATPPVVVKLLADCRDGQTFDLDDL